LGEGWATHHGTRRAGKKSVRITKKKEATMPKPDDETVLMILTILELLDKRESPEKATAVYRM
jgi:hypothetical protein